MNGPGGIVLDELGQLFADYEEAKASLRRRLGAFLRGRRAFVAGGIPVDVPGEPCFTPDLLVALDVDPRTRARWSVAEEGRGPDLVLQVYFDGDPDEPYRRDLERCARLGVAEYFVFDCLDPRLEGYRLSPAGAGPGEARALRPIAPEDGRLPSAVLGLDLAVEGARLDLRDGASPLPDPGHPAAPDPSASTRWVRFERHEGSGYPLRAVYPDGSWLAVNRANEGLFSGDPRGRIVQLLGRDRFRAASPRQFVQEYQRVYGQRLRDRTVALGQGNAVAPAPDAKRG